MYKIKDLKDIITTAVLVGDLETTREYMAILKRASEEKSVDWKKEDIEEVLSIMHGEEYISNLSIACKGIGDQRIFQAFQTALNDKNFLLTYRDKVQYYISSKIWIDNLVKVWIKEIDKLGIPIEDQETYLGDLIQKVLGGFKKEE